MPSHPFHRSILWGAIKKRCPHWCYSIACRLDKMPHYLNRCNQSPRSSREANCIDHFRPWLANDFMFPARMGTNPFRADPPLGMFQVHPLSVTCKCSQRRKHVVRFFPSLLIMHNWSDEEKRRGEIFFARNASKPFTGKCWVRERFNKTFNISRFVDKLDFELKMIKFRRIALFFSYRSAKTVRKDVKKCKFVIRVAYLQEIFLFMSAFISVKTSKPKWNIIH